MKEKLNVLKKKVLLLSLVSGMTLGGVTACSNEKVDDQSIGTEQVSVENEYTRLYHYKRYKKINGSWVLEDKDLITSVPFTTYEDDYWYDLVLYNDNTQEEKFKTKTR